MFEVILTYRPDLQESCVGQYATWEEALEKAQEMVFRHPEKIVRAWVRTVNDVQAKSREDAV